MSDDKTDTSEAEAPKPQLAGQPARSRTMSIALVAIPLAMLLAGAWLVLSPRGSDHEREVTPLPQATNSETDEQTTEPAARDALPVPTTPMPSPDGATPTRRMPSIDDFLKPDRRTNSEHGNARANIPVPAGGADAQDLPSVRPETPWLQLPDDTVLTRIAIGSCLHQRHAQPIWNDIVGLKRLPQLMLMIGDNVYGDVKSPDMRELVQAYRDQARHPDFAQARAKFPFLAMWDDHDYGSNDAGAAFPYRKKSAELFSDFWQIDPGRPPEDGIYYAKTYGSGDRRVQIIMLDTRSFRSKLKRKTANFRHWGKYSPDLDASKTMLGDAQWAWLEAQLREPAAIRIIVSSVQVLADGHGFERWGNLPLERARLLRLIERHKARGVILLSGDRHFGAIYATRMADRQIVAELTTSSLNRSYGPSQDGPSRHRLSKMFRTENFGLIDIDWRNARVVLSLEGRFGKHLEDLTMTFAELGIE